MKFTKYQHVERLGVDEVSGLFEGTVFIQPKVDGTNGSMWLEDDKVNYGSRKRHLYLTKDNAQFMETFSGSNDEKKILKYLTQHPEYTIFGEWLVQHVVKYDNSKYHRFYIFDVYDHQLESYVPYNIYSKELEALDLDHISIIPIIASGVLTPDDAVEAAKNNHYLLGDDSRLGEGVVVKRYDFVNQWGATVWGKYVIDDYRKNKNAPRAERDKPYRINPYEDAVYQLVTPAYVTKEFAKFKEGLNGSAFKSNDIGHLLNSIYHTFVSEETWHLLKNVEKDNKSTIIDFSQVRSAVIDAVKDALPTLFGRK